MWSIFRKVAEIKLVTLLDMDFIAKIFLNFSENFQNSPKEICPVGQNAVSRHTFYIHRSYSSLIFITHIHI